MILSFHPWFEADKNIICAGRNPDSGDLAAIKAADAVILNQGCYKSLYEMARDNCANVFPNYDARFKYPDKIGQTKLFQNKGVPLPKTLTFRNTDSFINNYGGYSERLSLDFPFVFKFDWGGEGENVYLIKSVEDLQDVLQKAAIYENTGQAGFLIQEYIPCQNRSLRVVVINRKIITYWRVLKNREGFCSNLSQGAVIDFDSDPDLQEMAAFSVKSFCRETKINLAGIDILFSSDAQIKQPLFLEINYFFGRQGLGGSDKYYKLLVAEIRGWIESL
ncbi:MAG: ATP-grasp domain-containing protein [Candidatus Desulfaltia sp.]|nr:ATP-grasp domain-containing protein [Candidatus Desulfaltia sp.]